MNSKIKFCSGILKSCLKCFYPGRNLVVYYISLVGFFILYYLYVDGWVSNKALSGKADLPELREFILLYLGPVMLMFLTTISKKLIDKDKDGISDDDEKK